jgi:hypothetical protein
MNPSIYQSFEYAHFIGLFLTILSLMILFRTRFYERVFQTADIKAFNMFAWGVISILLGMAFVHFHNIWVFKPRVLVTLIAWGILVKGILLIIFPDKFHDLFYRWTKVSALRMIFSIYLFLGLVLLIDGVRLMVSISKNQNIYAYFLSELQQMFV